jgi:nicotinate phosphoribosyltransferase
VVYKLVELDGRVTAKFSEDKHTFPGAKQVFRFDGHDVIACSWECLGCGHDEPQARALLRPVMLKGRLIEPLPDVSAARRNAAESTKRLPMAIRSLFDTDQHYRVEHSPALMILYEKVQNENSILRHRYAD